MDAPSLYPAFDFMPVLALRDLSPGRYIRLLQSTAHPQRWMWDEAKDLHELEFRFAPTPGPVDQARAARRGRAAGGGAFGHKNFGSS